MPPAVSLHALALWQPLLDAMLHAVWLMDARAQRIVAVNPAAGGLADTIASETCVTRRDGRAAPVTRRDGRLGPTPARGAPLCVVALHDRSRQVRPERELEVTVAGLSAAPDSTQDGILVVDLRRSRRG